MSSSLNLYLSIFISHNLLGDLCALCGYVAFFQLLDQYRQLILAGKKLAGRKFCVRLQPRVDLGKYLPQRGRAVRVSPGEAA